MTYWQLWLFLAIAFFIVEILTPSFFMICFSFGAILASAFSLFYSNQYIASIIFLFSAFLLAIFMRPILLKYFKLGKDEIKTNIDALIDKTGIVLEEIDNYKGLGRVKISGQDWSAKNAITDETIKKDSLVKVVKIEGVKLFVQKI